MIIMAPPSKSLRVSKVPLFCCLVFTLFASSVLVLGATDKVQSHESRLFLGRRSLLGKNDADDGDFLDEVVPRKKKSSLSSDNEDEIKSASKKKKSSSSSEDDEIVAPKKKKSSSNSDDDETVQLKKKKSSSKLEDDDDDRIQVPKKKKSAEDDELQVQKKKKSPTSSLSTTSTKNQTKISKPSSNSASDSSSTSKKEQSKLVKPPITSSKNKTKLTKPASKDVDLSSETPKLTIKLKKLNSTSSTPSKSSNPTKSVTKKSLDQLKSNSSTKNNPKISTEKSSTTATKSKDSTKKSTKTSTDTNTDTNKTKKPQSPPSWAYQDDEAESDLVQEFKDLPNKFHQSFIPDLHKISTTSKVYINKYNKEITKGFRPYVGNKYASTVATTILCTFIIVPFILVSLLFNQIKAYFSLQKLLIFIQIYLSIYFSILCFSSLITGLEPLRFFYATSQATYVWLQVLQTLAYVLYLLLLLMYLVLVFSTESDMGQKFLGLGQTFVGFAVGLHYYMTVFHRVVLRQPPKTTWKVHAVYATCFLVICLIARAERRKVEEKKS